MFERLTDRARRVVVQAQLEAARLNHDATGTEHLLLGLVHDDEGVAAKALRQLGIDGDAIRAQVEEVVGRGDVAATGPIPFTPQAKKALELSLREALQLGQDYIGTEHLLLGLIREGEGVAAEVLVTLGGDLSRVRDQVVKILGDSAVAMATAPRFLPPEMHPACPHCRTPLAEGGAVRMVAVTDVKAQHKVSAQVVYCGVCGLALGVLDL